MPRPDALPFTESEDANRLLATDPLALMIGMLLDQQFPMERAFLSPYLLAERLEVDRLDAAAIADSDTERLIDVFKGPPALHRFPGSMAKRAQSLCRVIADDYDNDAASVWTTSTDGAEFLKRLKALPGFGDAKANAMLKRPQRKPWGSDHVNV